MLTVNLALAPKSLDTTRPAGRVSPQPLQRQGARDLGPIWGLDATVDAFPRLEDVPVGYWPMIVRDDIGVAGAAGIHLDQDRQPFAREPRGCG